MDDIINKLEEMKSQIVDRAIVALKSDAEFSLEVIVALPRIRALLADLRQAQAQVQTNGGK